MDSTEPNPSVQWGPLEPPAEFLAAFEQPPKADWRIRQFDEADRMALVAKLDRAAQRAFDLSHALTEISAAVGQYDYGRDALPLSMEDVF